VASSPDLKAAIDRAVTLVNGFKGHPDSFGALHP
jgi:(1->4)-alpha-D-glucan 1-alpha-D-glucosylmutase